MLLLSLKYLFTSPIIIGMVVEGGKQRKEFSTMTRKQALNQAIKALSKRKGYEEVIQLLQDIHDELPLIHWSNKSIRDTVEQFILDNNGKIPTASDFKRKGMPPHPVIKQKYKITLGEWLEQNYPTYKPSYEELKEKYTNEFLKDYDRIKPKSQEEFNQNRTKGTRGWQTVAVYYDVKSWRNLVKALGLPLYFPMYRDRVKPQFKVAIHNDYDFSD